MNMKLKLLFVGKAALLVSVVGLAWTQVEAQAPMGRAAAVNERIRIDGRLDEAAWGTAVAIGNLTQVNPAQGKAPTEKTEVRVLASSDMLYFGITCYDRTPSAIVSTQLIRDAELEVDDHVAIAIDPFFDQRNGFFFMVNPAGARADGQIANNAEHPTLDWDGIWNAVSCITSDGWKTEIAIPFKSLRFKPGISVWGLNVQRMIKRRNETDRWAGPRRDIWFTNLAEAGQLEGMPEIHQGKGLDIRPYGLLRKTDGNWKLNGGLDVSKNLAPNLNASFTLNTDFAETEVDARQVNLTRFPLFYPEKRPFFLEGAGVFETAGSTPWHPDLLPFFSRRIGLYEGQEVPIIAGAKMIGRQSRYNIGFLDVQTNKVGDMNLSRQNLLAARVSRDFWKQSFVGGIFTHGNPNGKGNNSLIGLDARLATSSFQGNKNLIFDVFLFRTSDEGSKKSDYAAGVRIDYPNDLWDVSFNLKQIGDGFQPALGFVPRRGIRKIGTGAEFQPRPKKWGIRQFTFELRSALITNLKNVIENWSLAATPLGIEFESGDQVQFSVTPEFERLDEPFEISDGVTLPAGSYRWTRYQGTIETASKRWWMAQLGIGWGTFYSGTRDDWQLELTLKPSKHFLFGPQYERSNLSLKQGRFFTQIFSLQANYNFSSNVSWANLVQYDNESRILGFQSRFRWIIQPGNDLFLVLNRGWERTYKGGYLSVFDRGTVKLQYTFRF